MNEKVVKVYAEAFFELSKEKNKLDQNRQELKEIEKILKDNKKIALGILYGILGDEIVNLDIDNIALYHQIYKISRHIKIF